MPTHRTTPIYHPLGFQARCTCGWRGTASTIEDPVWSEADAHDLGHIVDAIVAAVQGGDRELAGPGSETLDEYRRRLGGDTPRSA